MDGSIFGLFSIWIRNGNALVFSDLANAKAEAAAKAAQLARGDLDATHIKAAGASAHGLCGKMRTAFRVNES